MDFNIWSILKCLTLHLVPLLGKNLSIPKHRYVKLMPCFSYRVLQPMLSLFLLLRQQIHHLQVSHTGNACFALLLWSSISLCSVGVAAHQQELSVKLLSWNNNLIILTEIFGGVKLWLLSSELDTKRDLYSVFQVVQGTGKRCLSIMRLSCSWLIPRMKWKIGWKPSDGLYGLHLVEVLQIAHMHIN